MRFRHAVSLSILLCAVPLALPADDAGAAPIAIPQLASRAYDSSLQVLRKLGEFDGYRSYEVQYDSDGLALRAVMNVPVRKMPGGGYPVLIMNHGKASDERAARFVDYYSTEQDGPEYLELIRFNPLARFAREGFVVLQPDYRGHGRSENYGKHAGAWQLDRHGERAVDRSGSPVPRILDDDGLRFNGWLYTAYYTIDVLNLIAALDGFDGAGIGIQLNAGQLFAWGRSLGGDVTARAITCTDRVRAASLWVPATTSLWDQAHHYHHDSPLYADSISLENLLVELRSYNSAHGTRLRARDLDPANFIERLRTPVMIQVSLEDEGVRSAWGIEYHYALLEHDVPTELRVYPGRDHVFRGDTYERAVQADLAFFRSYME